MVPVRVASVLGVKFERSWSSKKTWACQLSLALKKKYIAFLLLHILPSPENPALQVQINEPTVLLQYASAEQSCDPEEHSSVSSTKQWDPTLTND